MAKIPELQDSFLIFRYEIAIILQLKYFAVKIKVKMKIQLFKKKISPDGT